ncbi:MAG: acyl-CoA dehydratase activase [Candidatus Kariarchaeaceae archaeon]|jgi:benzoyl-CoA reductase subunit D
MITAGIDVGAKTVKVIIAKETEIIGKSQVLTGFDQVKAINEALEKALINSKTEKDQLDKIYSTGVGGKVVEIAVDTIPEVRAAASGMIHLYPNVRTVIDVGAEEGRATKCSSKGKVVDFVINEKCSAGSGTFVEAMARALEVELEDMGSMSIQSSKAVPMNAQCSVFAESEVVSLIHSGNSKEDISRAIHDAIASRIASMVRRIGVEDEVALIGGMAKNIGFVDSLKRTLEISDLIIPENPEYIGALGAALTNMN